MSPASTRIHAYLRQNVLGLIAIFIALSGVTWAANALPKNSVRSKTIKNGQVKGVDLATGAVTGAKVADDSLTGADIIESTLNIPLGGPPSGAAGGDLTGTYPNPTIAAGAVIGGLGGNVADDSLTGADIASQAVGPTELASLAVGPTHISPGAVGSAALAANLNNVIGQDDIASQGVGPSELASLSVGPTHIAPNAVSFSHIFTDAVRADELSAITIRTNSLSVPGGGTAQDGNMETRAVTASCDPGEQAIGGGSNWMGDVNDEELYTVESHLGAAEQWIVRGGNDTGLMRTLMAEVYCLGP